MRPQVSDDLHNEDGTHRSTAPSASGRAITRHEQKLREHTADGHTHSAEVSEPQTEVLSQHTEYRIRWDNDVIDGPFDTQTGAQKFAEQFHCSDRKVIQKRTVTTTATPWAVGD